MKQIMLLAILLSSQAFSKETKERKEQKVIRVNKSLAYYEEMTKVILQKH